MSYINGKFAQEWIEENHPENGWFRAYWTEDGVLAELSPDHLVEPQISLEDCGLGIRYEWEYKDGERADGESKGWYPNSEKWGNDKLKSVRVYKDGEKWGETMWYRSGAKECEMPSPHGIKTGTWTWWYENGQKMSESNYKDGANNRVGLWTWWYENGQKEKEEIWDVTSEVPDSFLQEHDNLKDSKLISEKYWSRDGIPTDGLEKGRETKSKGYKIASEKKHENN